MSEPGRVSSITAHPRRKQQYTVTIDNGQDLTLHEDVIVALGLRAGKLLDEAILEQIAIEVAVTEARESALRLLSIRQRSELEIIRALQKKQIPDDIIQRTIQSLTSLGLINDEQYAQDLADSLARRKRTGRRAIVYKLRQAGVDTELAEQTVKESLAGVDETERASDALTRQLPKWADLPQFKRRARAWQYLSRLGFDGDTIAEALRLAIDDD